MQVLQEEDQREGETHSFMMLVGDLDTNEHLGRTMCELYQLAGRERRQVG